MNKRLLWVSASLIAAFTLTGCTRSVALFNGQNLDGWKPYLEDQSIDPATVWSVQDGVIHCKGKPNGYIRTTTDYSNYHLHVEWRWTGEPSNSGVLLHSIGPDQLWPLCVEAQLMHEHAGDFVTLQKGSAITVNGRRYQPPEDAIYKIIPKQTDSTENPPGQWNSYDIVCKDDMIELYVNGTLQNSATKSNLTAGAICLQSEGTAIEFRNITLKPQE